MVVERLADVRVGGAQEREYELLLLLEMPRGLAFEECEERRLPGERSAGSAVAARRSFACAGERVVMVVGQSDECRVALHAAAPRGLASGTGAPLR